MIASGVFAGAFELDYASGAPGPGRQDARRRARAHRLRGRPAGRRPAGRGAVRAAHRAGADPRGRGQADRRSSPAARAPAGTTPLVIGAEAHAGPTPMERRRDPLRAAAALLEEIYQIAHAARPDGRATVGEFQAYPGSRNTVPGRVRFTVDLRHPDGATMDAMDRSLARRCSSGRRPRSAPGPPAGSSRSGTRRRSPSIPPASTPCARRRRRSACRRGRS